MASRSEASKERWNKIFEAYNANPARCKVCGNPIEYSRRNVRKYCSKDCGYVDRKKETLELRLSQLSTGDINDDRARFYFRKISEHRCSICGITEWMGEPAPLVVDHIDGNPENNSIENFRMVCNNCDALSSTYMGKNRGNGRKSRRKVYAPIA